MIYETPELVTERLIIKRGILDDYKKVYQYDFTKLRNINGIFELEEQDLKKIEGFEIPREGEYDWIVYLKDDMTPIANIVADREVKDIRAIELAYNTHPNYWRKGYTTEAIIEIIKFLFNKGYENILSGYDEGNFKSKGICEKIGFIPYLKKENAYILNEKSIITYMTILSKERFNELYIEKKQKR